MKKTIVVLLLLAALAGGAYYAYGKWLKPAKTPAAQTTTAKVERGLIRQTVSATGRVVANLDVDIKCKASGEVIKLPFDISDAVKKGDLLLELDPVDQQRVLRQAEVSLAAAQARLATAKANLTLAERALATDRQRAGAAIEEAQAQADDAAAKAERLRLLLDKQLSSKEEYDTARTTAVQAKVNLQYAQVRIEELKTQEEGLEVKRQDVKLAQSQVDLDVIAKSVAEDRLADTKVPAPLDGVISARSVQIGQIIASAVSNVGGGTAVLTVSDLAHLFVVAAVDESDIGRVQVGQRVLITADAYQGRRFSGQVVRIATKGVNLSNVITFEVKIEVTGDQRTLLKPEMTANVEIVCQEKPDALLVPVEALTRQKGKAFVTLAATAPGAAPTERPVEVGISDGLKTEIKEGLTDGDTVVLHQSGPDSRWTGGQRPAGGPRRGMMLH